MAPVPFFHSPSRARCLSLKQTQVRKLITLSRQVDQRSDCHGNPVCSHSANSIKYPLLQITSLPSTVTTSSGPVQSTVNMVGGVFG